MRVCILWTLLVLIVAARERGVFENGLAEVCHPIDLPTDILFVMDGSGSVGGPTFDTQISTLHKIVDLAEIGPSDTQIAVMQYSSYTYVEFPFKTHANRETLRAAINQIRHRSGTTKMGKALDKALQLFTAKTTGSRYGQTGVQQIAIVVGDGHSHDNPFPAANRLRQAGIKVMALGIGQHLNMQELMQITENPKTTFDNLSLPTTLHRFVEVLKENTKGEECEYLRGKEGAQIECQRDTVSVKVTTKRPFSGAMYVNGQFERPECSVRPNSTDFELSFGLLDCGMDRQFSINPKGTAFSAAVTLQFHPDFATAADHQFNIHCFYPDRSAEGNELDWQLIKEHTQRRDHDDSDQRMPCAYRMALAEKSDFCDSAPQIHVGDAVLHTWNCTPENFDVYQSVFVHNCDFVDLRSGARRPLIDANGCSLEPDLIETPEYPSATVAQSKGKAFNAADGSIGQIECEVRFCDRLMNECEKFLPPKCHSIVRREAGFAVGIRPLNWDDRPPLVTFSRSEKEREKLKSVTRRRRPDSEQSVSTMVQTRRAERLVAGMVGGDTFSDGRVIARLPPSVDVKLSTQNLRIVDSPNATAAAGNQTADGNAVSNGKTSISTGNVDSPSNGNSSLPTERSESNAPSGAADSNGNSIPKEKPTISNGITSSPPNGTQPADGNSTTSGKPTTVMAADQPISPNLTAENTAEATRTADDPFGDRRATADSTDVSSGVGEEPIELEPKIAAQLSTDSIRIRSPPLDIHRIPVAVCRK